MFEAFEEVVLTADIPEYHLEAGDMGTIVDIDKTGQQVVLEFFALDGRTLAVVPVSIHTIRTVGSNEIAHVRQLS